MPVIRVCYYCNNRFLASTYQMARHSEECKRKIELNHNQPIYLERGWKENENSQEGNASTQQGNASTQQGNASTQ